MVNSISLNIDIIHFKNIGRDLRWQPERGSLKSLLENTIEPPGSNTENPEWHSLS